MKKIKKNKNNYYIKSFVFLFLFFVSIFFFSEVEASSLTSRLSGRILLQVESKGEAYYVNPGDLKKYYLGRPDDAFVIMRSFGLGATNIDINNFLKNGARANLSGKILLQVQDKGQAYYVNPLNLRLYYLGRPADAFAVMRQLGLGIKNSDLDQIVSGVLGVSSSGNSGTTVNPGEKLVLFSWKYKNKQYSLEQVFSDSLYNSYKNSDKNYYYPANNPPENLREAYYSIFLTQKSGDNSIDNLIADLRKIANQEGFSDDQFVEFVMALVQYLPYDFSKKSTDPQNFPYETLYTGTGICSDTTFLSVLILRKLGYGAAVFDYPNVKHSAAAVACSQNSSYNSGYCFVETTNYFPIGVFPSSIGTGQAEGSGTNWNTLFSGTSLGEVEILQKSGGKYYGGMSNTINTVNSIVKMQQNLIEKGSELKSLQDQLSQVKSQLDQISAQAEVYKQASDWTNYNLKVEEYNLKVNEYNAILNNYRLKLDVYNFDVVLFNQTVKDFYQN
ncbi:MAG: hypothetical protein WC164_00355 [Patescibacteria group bacterium]|nr:hypothetical protein [Patescibacteria group bacterium]